MSATDASTSKAEGSSKVAETHKEDEQPALGILEEDDEFEEFPVTGVPALRSELGNILTDCFARCFQTGTTQRPTLRTSKALHLVLRSLPAISCGRIIGMTTISRTTSACNYGALLCIASQIFTLMSLS